VFEKRTPCCNIDFKTTEGKVKNFSLYPNNALSGLDELIQTPQRLHHNASQEQDCQTDKKKLEIAQFYNLQVLSLEVEQRQKIKEK